MHKWVGERMSRKHCAVVAPSTKGISHEAYGHLTFRHFLPGIRRAYRLQAIRAVLSEAVQSCAIKPRDGLHDRIPHNGHGSCRDPFSLALQRRTRLVRPRPIAYPSLDLLPAHVHAALSREILKPILWHGVVLTFSRYLQFSGMPPSSLQLRLNILQNNPCLKNEMSCGFARPADLQPSSTPSTDTFHHMRQTVRSTPS